MGEEPPAPAPAANASAPGGQRAPAPEPTIALDGIDGLLAQASLKMPGWRAITFQLPRESAKAVVFSLDRGTGGQPQERAQLTLSRASGKESKWEPFSAQSPGRRARSFLRFAHTGEYYGLTGQTIAGLVSLGSLVLVWTGLALALRRLATWRARRVRARVEDAPPIGAAPVWRDRADANVAIRPMV
jgi:uncharacterized iron-regulated membrane protein